MYSLKYLYCIFFLFHFILFIFFAFDFIKFIKPKGSDIHLIRHEKTTPYANCLFYIVTYLDSSPYILYATWYVTMWKYKSALLRSVVSWLAYSRFTRMVFFHTDVSWAYDQDHAICTVFIKKICVKEIHNIYCHNLFVLIKYSIKLIQFRLEFEIMFLWNVNKHFWGRVDNTSLCDAPNLYFILIRQNEHFCH